jgi:hypothetical protein
MVNLGHIALDGTKLKASGSKHKAMSYGDQFDRHFRVSRKNLVEMCGYGSRGLPDVCPIFTAII